MSVKAVQRFISGSLLHGKLGNRFLLMLPPQDANDYKDSGNACKASHHDTQDSWRVAMSILSYKRVELNEGDE